jgi:hypothetical protein
MNMGISITGDTEFDQATHSLNMGLLKGLHSVIEIDFPCVMDDGVDALQKLFIFGIFQPESFSPKLGLEKLYPTRELLEVGKAFLLQA